MCLPAAAAARTFGRARWRGRDDHRVDVRPFEQGLDRRLRLGSELRREGRRAGAARDPTIRARPALLGDGHDVDVGHWPAPIRPNPTVIARASFGCLDRRARGRVAVSPRAIAMCALAPRATRPSSLATVTNWNPARGTLGDGRPRCACRVRCRSRRKPPDPFDGVGVELGLGRRPVLRPGRQAQAEGQLPGSDVEASTPGVAAIASTLRTPSSVSIITTHAASSSASSRSEARTKAPRNGPTERWPRSGKWQASTAAASSSALPTIGTMMATAPMSSANPIAAKSLEGTRVVGPRRRPERAEDRGQVRAIREAGCWSTQFSSKPPLARYSAIAERPWPASRRGWACRRATAPGAD